MEIPKDLQTDNPERLLAQVYADNFDWLTNYVLRNSGTTEDAADVFQEAVSAAWLNLRGGKFTGDAGQFNAYVRQICKYKWIAVLRSSARARPILQEDLSLFEELSDQGNSLDEQQRQIRRLQASFDGIGEKCRELLSRFYFRRQSLAKIAAAMNHTEESAKTIKYRCMMRLRKIYLEQYGTDE